jgi:hypothetical protein
MVLTIVCCTWDFFMEHSIPNLEDQVTVFMSPSDRVAQLYPQALGSLFIAFYNLQGYGGWTYCYAQNNNYFCLSVVVPRA